AGASGSRRASLRSPTRPSTVFTNALRGSLRGVSRPPRPLGPSRASSSASSGQPSPRNTRRSPNAFHTGAHAQLTRTVTRTDDGRLEDSEDPPANYTTDQLHGPTRALRPRTPPDGSSLCGSALPPSATREY